LAYAEGDFAASKYMAPSNTARLFRYTNLPVLLDMLHEKHITLLSPATWEDRNDAYYLDQYKQQSKLGSVLAICFTQEGERFHFWRIFSNGTSGVCVEFDKDRLLQTVDGQAGFRHGSVKYRLRRDLEKDKPPVSIWPFLKRNGFRDEKEYRIIFETKTVNAISTSVSIDLHLIKSVIFSPWLPPDMQNSIVTVIRSIDGCAGLKLRSSDLIDNARWKAAIT